MRFLAVIPARGGSQGIKGKNLAPLGGRPLIAWTIEAARSCASLTTVVVSTDSDEIASAARANGAVAPFLRPADLSTGKAPVIGAVRHALDFYAREGRAFDAIVLLQPTSPFRRADQIEAAVGEFQCRRPDTLVSVIRVPHNMVPSSLMRRVGREDGLWLESPAGQVVRRQDKETAYARNGPAILIVASEEIARRDRLYGERVIGFEMDWLTSLDIDEPADLELANVLLPLCGGQRS